MRLTEDKLNRTLKIVAIITLSLIALFVFSQFKGLVSAISAGLKSVIVPFLVAFLFNFILYPIVEFFEDKGVRPRWLIVSVIFLVIFGILIGIIVWVSPYVVHQLNQLITERFPAIFDNLMESLERMNFSPDLIDQVTGQLRSGVESYVLTLIESLSKSLSLLFEVLVTIVLIPIILFFMMKDYDLVGDGILKAVPSRWREHFAILSKRINEVTGLYLRGQFLIMIGIGTVATIGYSLIGLDYAILFGIIVGLTNIIPYIGATIAAIVPVTYALLSSSGPEWWVVLALNIGFQFVEGNILQPVIMSKQLDMHPLIIIAAILGFGSLLGVVGVIFATPIAGIIKVSVTYYQEVKGNKINLNERELIEGSNNYNQLGG